MFQADAPNLQKIPQAEWIGVTVLLLTCKYRGQEFIRIGYYVSNQYEGKLEQVLEYEEGEDIGNDDEEEEEEEEDPMSFEEASNEQEKEVQEEEEEEEEEEQKAVVRAKFNFTNFDQNLLIRSILSEKPRVTHFNINWNDS